MPLSKMVAFRFLFHLVAKHLTHTVVRQIQQRRTVHHRLLVKAKLELAVATQAHPVAILAELVA